MTTHAHSHDHAQKTGGKSALNRRAALASVGVAVFLVSLKIWATWSTGSVAMLGSLADTALDLFASLVTLFGVVYAAQPADAEHRFGHGKAEALAGLFQVVLVTLSALGIGYSSVMRFLSGDTTASAESGIAVSVIAIIVTLGLLAYQRAIIRQTASVAIGADHVHYQSDLLLNGAVIAALLLDQYLGLAWADPAFGFIIAAWLLYGAYRAAHAAVDQLMDREWPDAKRARLEALANTHPKLHGIHDVRTRSSGAQDFVQFHIWVDPKMTVAAAHDVMDEVEAIVMAEFPDVEVFIHPDPAGHPEDGVPAH